MSFDTLKKNRSDMINKLREAAEKTDGGGKSFNDDRIWSPTIDKAGNGYAVIRFLPGTSMDPTPWIRYWDHGFKGPTGRWYIEKSLTSIGQDDPVSQMNSLMWNSGNEEDKQVVRERKRRLHYVSNVLVISDPGNPANEGKVFIFKYGKKIFDKVKDLMQPQFQDEQPINPFDFWEGANFKLKIRNVEGYRNYDKSEFDKPTALFGGNDEKLETVYNSLYSLNEFIDPKTYKSYDELKKKLNEVLGNSAAKPSNKQSVELDETVSQPSVAPVASQPAMDEDDGGADDAMAYFAKLADQD